MYWSFWGTTNDGEPLIENVSEKWVDARLADEQSNKVEIIFEAELVTGE